MSTPTLRKGLGQHHLTSGALCRPLLEFLAPAGARVIEIGPGGGVLTRELVATGARVAGYELDLAWAFTLRHRLAAEGLGCGLAVADALHLDWSRLTSPTLVAGNLPYNVGTAILRSLLPYHHRVPRAGFLLQKEVAERLVAAPGSAAYGALSVLAQAQAQPRLLGRLRPGAFNPPPKVESCFVGLVLTPPPLPPAAMPAFERTVFLAFGQRRKMLRNALGSGWGRQAAEAALAGAGLPATARAEELGVSEFLALHRAHAEGGGQRPPA